jgi:prephenate dehydrogenase
VINTQKPVAILGGAGKMGRWLAKALLAEGQPVILLDKDEGRLLKAQYDLHAVASTDLAVAVTAGAIVLAVPIGAFEAAVKEIAPLTHPGQIVIDISSVKAMPVLVMHKYLPRCRVLGTHPVFGPGASGLKGHNIVLTPTSPDEEALANQLKPLLEARGGTVTMMTPQAHDRAMAAVLGLSHYLAIVAGDTLLGLEGLKDMAAVSGTTFRALLTMVVSVLAEDPALYASIQMSLPDLPDLEEAFVENAQEWADLTISKDRVGFMRHMAELKEKLTKLGLDQDEAYRGLYRLAGDGQE